MFAAKMPRTLILVACGFAGGAFFIWLLLFAWEHDANPRRANFKNQMMRRKVEAMDQSRHSILRGRLPQVNAAAARMHEYARTIEGFLATDVYKKHGDEFYEAIEELRIASGADDREGTKEAFLRLERSCIDCHYLLAQPD
jgi:hypothetical protein